MTTPTPEQQRVFYYMLLRRFSPVIGLIIAYLFYEVTDFHIVVSLVVMGGVTLATFLLANWLIKQELS
jgi:hypothetical protein